MGAILDIVGSFIIGGLILLLVLSVNGNVSQMATEEQMRLMVQENITELAEEIEYDFRKIAYRFSTPSSAIISADSVSIKFWCDIDNDGVQDSVRYWLGPTSGTPGTPNPRDRILYRKVNNQTIGGALGVVDFRLTYFNSSGAQTANLTQVKSILFSLTVESPFPIDTTYTQSSWSALVRPRNL